MLEEIFPFSYRVRNVLYLVAVILVYLFLPIFITVVGSIAASVPYVSAVLVLLTVVPNLGSLIEPKVNLSEL